MAALTAADVTILSVGKERVGRMAMHVVDIKFGDNTKTYPAGGIPLPALGNFGLHKAISFAVPEQPVDDGYSYHIDKVNHKLQIFYNVMDIKVLGGAAPDAQSTMGTIASGGPKLSKEAATAQTITGADAGTKGGVVPAPRAEVPATFVPATNKTVRFMIVGR